jgi:hypothetical protein
MRELQQRLDSTEARQNTIISFLGRVAHNPAVLQQLVAAAQHAGIQRLSDGAGGGGNGSSAVGGGEGGGGGGRATRKKRRAARAGRGGGGGGGDESDDGINIDLMADNPSAGQPGQGQLIQYQNNQAADFESLLHGMAAVLQQPGAGGGNGAGLGGGLGGPFDFSNAMSGLQLNGQLPQTVTIQEQPAIFDMSSIPTLGESCSLLPSHTRAA